jgi:hypothetical protein
VVKNIDWEKEIPCDLVLNDISEEMTSNKPAVFLCTLTNLKNTHFEFKCKTRHQRHLAVIVALCLSENSVVYKKFVSSKPPSRSDY